LLTWAVLCGCLTRQGAGRDHVQWSFRSSGRVRPQNDPRRKDAEDRLCHHLPADADDID
ncbi:hypothetical protein E4U34_007366, partial [Claviceps purpurea]